jgi:outer membrane protein
VSIQVAQYTLNSALHDVDLVRGELRPTVTLQGAVSASHGASDSSSESNTASISANVSVPLYQSGAVYSRLRASKHTAAQRRLEVDVARKQARESSLQAWENLNSARAQIVSIKDQINAAQVALEGVQREAQVGSRTVLDVLDAEQELLDARVNLVTAERDEKVAAFTLFASLGQLSAQNLQLDVPYYTPEKHADDVRGIWLGSSESADEDEKRAAK